MRQASQNEEEAWRRNVQEQLERLQDSLAQSQVSWAAIQLHVVQQAAVPLQNEGSQSQRHENGLSP